MISFGTGGWRAIIGDDFTKENVRKLMFALAQRMKREDVADKSFCIGYDRRFLSREAAEWAAEVMAGEGIHVLMINREAPTPLIMFTVQYYGLDYGIAVTASHNPALYNGIKLFTKGGRDAVESVTNELGAAANDVDPKEIHSIEYKRAIAAGLVQEINPQNQYLDAIIRGVNMDAIRSRNLQIVLDPMYGVSRTSLQTILLTARCDVSVIHERHDTLFGGRLPAPNVDTLGALQAAVLQNHADIGIATDGDADRLGIIDDEGHFVHPNQVLVLLYYYLLKYKNWHGPCVRNIATTHLLDRVAEAFGETCYEVPVGFKHISAAMQEHNAVIGGESSGGLTVRGHINGKDGIYAATLLVEMLSVTGKSMSQPDEGDLRRVRHRLHERVRLALRSGNEGKAAPPADGGKAAARLPDPRGGHQLHGRLQGTVRERLDHRPVQRHGTPAAHLLRNAHPGGSGAPDRRDGGFPRSAHARQNDLRYVTVSPEQRIVPLPRRIF